MKREFSGIKVDFTGLKMEFSALETVEYVRVLRGEGHWTGKKESRSQGGWLCTSYGLAAPLEGVPSHRLNSLNTSKLEGMVCSISS